MKHVFFLPDEYFFTVDLSLIIHWTITDVHSKIPHTCGAHDYLSKSSQDCVFRRCRRVHVFILPQIFFVIVTILHYF